MTNFLTQLNQLVWNPDFWLPSGFTWSDLEIYNKSDLKFTLYYPVLAALALFVVRIIFESLIGRPLARCLKIKERPRNAKLTPNPRLDVYYQQNQGKNLSESIILQLEKETGMTSAQIKDWFHQKRNQFKTGKMKKFTETCWRFVFYLSIWVYGFVTLYKKSWFWDTNDCWRGYPEHHITDDIYWYYTIELGFYLSLLITQFFDVKRKDFFQMFLHHVVTIMLIVFSYSANFTRIGTLVLLVHDCADFWLELAKTLVYLKQETFSNIIFGMFVLTWFVTRLTIFPIKILYNTTFEAPGIMGLFPAYYLFNILLYVLQVMHVIWFYIIIKIAYKSIMSGAVTKDDRSESSGSSTGTDDNKKK